MPPKKKDDTKITPTPTPQLDDIKASSTEKLLGEIQAGGKIEVAKALECILLHIVKLSPPEVYEERISKLERSSRKNTYESYGRRIVLRHVPFHSDVTNGKESIRMTREQVGSIFSAMDLSESDVPDCYRQKPYEGDDKDDTITCCKLD